MMEPGRRKKSGDDGAGQGKKSGDGGPGRREGVKICESGRGVGVGMRESGKGKEMKTMDPWTLIREKEWRGVEMRKSVEAKEWRKGNRVGEKECR
ncbi:hypothetical protein PoB_007479200 [Plakobranchus ocellatus]|uniref:Uncharacterized protein n=1 Tax=Plakobranchus ocellatus TaxID=259542 RepID=A0AAV4DVG9_9GAST|nr:hypothetical protein PoB_007479200 [Plakobranchus ocellatus]